MTIGHRCVSTVVLLVFAFVLADAACFSDQLDFNLPVGPIVYDNCVRDKQLNLFTASGGSTVTIQNVTFEKGLYIVVHDDATGDTVITIRDSAVSKIIVLKGDLKTSNVTLLVEDTSFAPRNGELEVVRVNTINGDAIDSLQVHLNRITLSNTGGGAKTMIIHLKSSNAVSVRRSAFTLRNSELNFGSDGDVSETSSLFYSSWGKEINDTSVVVEGCQIVAYTGTIARGVQMYGVDAHNLSVLMQDTSFFVRSDKSLLSGGMDSNILGFETGTMFNSNLELQGLRVDLFAPEGRETHFRLLLVRRTDGENVTMKVDDVDYKTVQEDKATGRAIHIDVPEGVFHWMRRWNISVTNTVLDTNAHKRTGTFILETAIAEDIDFLWKNVTVGLVLETFEGHVVFIKRGHWMHSRFTIDNTTATVKLPQITSISSLWLVLHSSLTNVTTNIVNSRYVLAPDSQSASINVAASSAGRLTNSTINVIDSQLVTLGEAGTLAPIGLPLSAGVISISFSSVATNMVVRSIRTRLIGDFGVGVSTLVVSSSNTSAVTIIVIDSEVDALSFAHTTSLIVVTNRTVLRDTTVNVSGSTMRGRIEYSPLVDFLTPHMGPIVGDGKLLPSGDALSFYRSFVHDSQFFVENTTVTLATNQTATLSTLITSELNNCSISIVRSTVVRTPGTTAAAAHATNGLIAFLRETNTTSTSIHLSEVDTQLDANNRHVAPLALFATDAQEDLAISVVGSTIDISTVGETELLGGLLAVARDTALRGVFTLNVTDSRLTMAKVMGKTVVHAIVIDGNVEDIRITASNSTLAMVGGGVMEATTGDVRTPISFTATGSQFIATPPAAGSTAPEPSSSAGAHAAFHFWPSMIIVELTDCRMEGSPRGPVIAWPLNIGPRPADRGRIALTDTSISDAPAFLGEDTSNNIPQPSPAVQIFFPLVSFNCVEIDGYLAATTDVLPQTYPTSRQATSPDPALREQHQCNAQWPTQTVPVISHTRSPPRLQTASVSPSSTTSCQVTLHMTPTRIPAAAVRAAGFATLRVELRLPDGAPLAADLARRNVARRFAGIIDVTANLGAASVVALEANESVAVVRVNVPPTSTESGAELKVFGDTLLRLHVSSESFDCQPFDLDAAITTDAILTGRGLPVPITTINTVERIATATTTVGALAANPTPVVQQARIGALIGLGSCDYAHDEQLMFTVNPLGWAAGRRNGMYYRGALVGHMFLTILVLGLAAAVTLVFFDPRLPSALWRAMGVIHLPGVLVVPVAMLTQSAASVSASLFFHGDDPFDPGFAIGAWAVLLTIIATTMMVTTVSFKATVIKRANESVVTSSAFARFTLWLFLSHNKWIDDPAVENSAGFKQHWQEVFYDYKPRLPWYLSVELLISIAIGFLDGVRSPAQCETVGWIMLVLVCIQTLGAFVARPFMTPYEALFHMLLSALTCGSAACGVIGNAANSDVLVDIGVRLAVAVGIVATIKSFLDLLFLLRWFFSRYQRATRIREAASKRRESLNDDTAPADADEHAERVEARTDEEESVLTDTQLIAIVDALRVFYLRVTCQKDSEGNTGLQIVSAECEAYGGHGVELEKLVGSRETTAHELNGSPRAALSDQPTAGKERVLSCPPPIEQTPADSPSQQSSSPIAFSPLVAPPPRRPQLYTPDDGTNGMVVLPEYVRNERLAQLVLHICKRQLKKKISNNPLLQA